MSDYNFDTDVLRGQMADQLAGNIEQLAFVLTNALANVSADDVIEAGELGDEASEGNNADLVIFNLRKIAQAIEDGDLK